MRDYETIDARASAGVYDVASLTLPSTQPLDAFLREDAAECGELLKAAGAEKSAPRVVKNVPRVGASAPRVGARAAPALGARWPRTSSA